MIEEVIEKQAKKHEADIEVVKKIIDICEKHIINDAASLNARTKKITKIINNLSLEEFEE